MKKRNLADVIAEMLPVLREHFPNAVKPAEHVAYSASFTAPELQGARWNELASVLNAYLPPPKTSEASAKVAAIFMGAKS